MKLAIRNGRVAQGDSLQDIDVLVEDGLVTGLGHVGPADSEIDATGCYVLPGFLDFHTHVDDRIGPWYLADTYETATAEALRNGITTLCTFVTQGPGGSLAQAMAVAREKAVGRSHGDVLWHLTPTSFEARDMAFLETVLRAGYRTLKLYTTYRPAGLYESYRHLEELFGSLDATFLVHCEDDALIAEAAGKGIDFSRASSICLNRPEAAEIEAIRQVTSLALAAGASLHVVHVSTEEGARILGGARAQGDITSETCPQYLHLDDSWLDRKDGHRWLCTPPLRGGRESFRALAREGAFEILATDHCPFRPEHKDAWDGLDFRRVPNGLPGLGGLPHLAWRLWGEDPDRAALALAAHLSSNPARRAGMDHRKGALRTGLDADVVVLDPRGPERPIRSTASACHEPFPGFTTKLHFRSVLLRGVPRVQDGRLLEPERPLGVPLQPDPETLPST